MPESGFRIHFSPRFHVNLYHSYRGDTPDEQGFGKDIRIIRGILDDLDRLEKEGITLRCAWDFDNAFSLGKMLPAHAPDILERIRRRISEGYDEAHLMSWNNGLLTAHTTEEFRLAVNWAKTAPDGSGTQDKLGSFVPIVRPQECMVTPSHLRLYREAGVEALSLYYSAIPFNAVGSFIPRLPVLKRFNPLLLKEPQSDSSIRMLPAFNQGDIAEYRFSLRRMIKQVRREQLASEEPADLMMLLDMDADDTFWEGFSRGITSRVLPSFAGLYSLAKSIADLPFLSFTKAWDYLQTHDDQGSITLGQDLADGAFDGYASWAEKYENYHLWTKVTAARELWDETKKLTTAKKAELNPDSIDDFHAWSSYLPEHLQPAAFSAVTARLQLLSTTHFGLSAPVMNTERLAKAEILADTAVAAAASLLEDLRKTLPDSEKTCDGEDIRIQNHAKPPFPGEARHRKDGSILLHSPNNGWNNPVTMTAPWVEYGSRIRAKTTNLETEQKPLLSMSGVISLGSSLQSASAAVTWKREIHLISAEEGANFIANCTMEYPATAHRGFSKLKAARLKRTWDERWKQTAPCEIIAFENLSQIKTVRVWKQNFSGSISSYPLNYIKYADNQSLASINNHVTPSWIAVSDGNHGVLVAQNRQGLHGFAFCPIRQALESATQTISLNPFGTYWGPQYHYPAAVSGLGRWASLLTAEHLHPSAPSWEGKNISFSLLIVLYKGDMPSEGVRKQAIVFSNGLMKHGCC
jgi:hypothetical protein